MMKLKRREEDLPSPSWIKQLNACWKEKIKTLNNIVQACSQDISKREEIFKRPIEIDISRGTCWTHLPHLEGGGE
jgi:hypothetical protein